MSRVGEDQSRPLCGEGGLRRRIGLLSEKSGLSNEKRGMGIKPPNVKNGGAACMEGSRNPCGRKGRLADLGEGDVELTRLSLVRRHRYRRHIVSYSTF